MAEVIKIKAKNKRGFVVIDKSNFSRLKHKAYVHPNDKLSIKDRLIKFASIIGIYK